VSTNFIIDRNLCNSCGLCVRECIRHVNIPHQKHVNPKNPACSRCYHCLAVCPSNAIKVKDTYNVSSSCGELPNPINENDLKALFSLRRSHRKFTKETVSDETLEGLVNSAILIPSGGNRHSYEFTVIKSDKMKNKLREALTTIYKRKNTIINNPILRTIASFITDSSTRGFLKDKNYRNRMKDLINRICKSEDPLFYDAPIVIIIHSKEQIPTPKEDSILAGYNIILMAQTMGLGTCFVTLAQKAINSSRKCKEILNLSPKDNINAVILLGHPAADYYRPAPRFHKEIKWL